MPILQQNHDGKIETAEINRTFLGREDHGIPTCMITLHGKGWAHGFGGYDLRVHTTYVQTLLDALRVPQWEKLQGTKVRLFTLHNQAIAIGHLTEDRWMTCDREGPRIIRQDGSTISEIEY